MNTFKMRSLYIISIVLLVLFAATFLLMPISTNIASEYARIAAMVVGIIFWFTGICGYSILIYIYRIAKKMEKRKGKWRLYLFSNKISAVSEVIFLISTICLIVMIYLELSRYYAVYIVLFIVVLTFNMHWLFSRNLHIKIWQNKKHGRKAK